MLKLAIISPFPPAVGGMAVLAETLKTSLETQEIEVISINTNPIIKAGNRFERINKILQFWFYIFNLRKVYSCDASIIISSSGDFFYAKALPALYFCKLFKCKSILDFVGGGVLPQLENKRSRITKHLKKFDCIIVPSTPFQESFERAGIRCELLPHIVRIEKFQQNRGLGVEPVFLSAKNLQEYSNVESIIRAFALIKKQCSNARLLITGRGPQEGYLKALAKDLNLSDVDFLENLSNEEMPLVFGRATFFLHATRIESFGIAIVEALASGLAVISSNVGGIPDIIKDGENGYLIEYNDHESMATKALFLLKNKLIYQEIVSEGVKTAQSYSAKNLSPRLIDLIERIINDK